MLFPQRFHPGIREGATTLTFRAWRRPLVRAGARRRLDADGVIEVEAVDEVELDSITTAEVRLAGFESVEELLAELRRTSRGRLAGAARVTRIRFRYVAHADPRLARRDDAGTEALARVAAELEAIDRRSRRGPWTTTILQLIAANPGVAASQLAPRAGREPRLFKADVRRLKELGLTESLAVGYRLSRRGRALLDH